MRPKITAVHHIALKACGAEDFRKTVHFYHQVLGMPIARSWGDGDNAAVMIDTGAGLLEIFANGTSYPGQGALHHLAFQVEDADACVEAVRAAGYKITVEPKDIVIGSVPPYPARIAFCIGPVGEELEFFQVK